MAALNKNTQIKVIGQSGQLSLGKEYAGRTVLVEETEPGVWRIRTATVIPDNEQYLHQAEAKASLERAMAYASAHPVQATSAEDLERLKNAQP